MEKIYLLITSFIFFISLLAYFKVQNLANLVLVRNNPDEDSERRSVP